MSDGERTSDGRGGISVLRTDLTPAQLAAAPTLADVDLLLIDGLTESEDDAFAAAIAS